MLEKKRKQKACQKKKSITTHTSEKKGLITKKMYALNKKNQNNKIPSL